MRGTDELRIWYRRRPGAWQYAFPVILFAVVVVERPWIAGAWAVLTFTQVLVARRGVTVLTPAHVATGVLRRRRAPWADVWAIRASEGDPQAYAVLHDGSAFALRAVYWHAPRIEGHGPPGSVQTVVEWARAHGHDVVAV